MEVQRPNAEHAPTMSIEDASLAGLCQPTTPMRDIPTAPALSQNKA